MEIYDFSVRDKDGNQISLSRYKGKVLLIVNTATECGFTPQYKELQRLYDEYQEQGFEILDFPCNQFGNQAPGLDEEIDAFCMLKYQTTFPRFAKIKVNGKEADPLYQFLKDKQKALPTSRVAWNFTKFLVDRDGNVVSRFASAMSPAQIEPNIQKLL